MRSMARTVAALALLAPLGCASGGSRSRAEAGAPPQATSRTQPLEQQISPAHPYCMNERHAGRLRECVSFGFGRCLAYGAPCDKPGFATPPPGAGESTASPSGTATAP